MVVAQQLSDRDKENRTTLSENCLNILTDDELILMSDKAHFHLSGAVKKQNFRYWADSNPQQLHQRPLYCPHVIVWCGVASFGIAGWTSGYSHICSVCGDVKELSCSRITSSRNRPQEGVGPARWDYSPHCQIIHARCARNVSGPGYFKSSRHSMACTFFLTSQCVIIFFGGTSSLKCTLRNHVTLMSLRTQ
jgi:hypothetical protein